MISFFLKEKKYRSWDAALPEDKKGGAGQDFSRRLEYEKAYVTGCCPVRYYYTGYL